MKCWLLHPIYAQRWQPFDSIKAARDTFWSDADDAINRWGQSEDAWSVAWVLVQRHEPEGGDLYPDRLFHYDIERDTVREEKT